MKTIDLYIIEKLKINKDSKIDDNPLFSDINDYIEEYISKDSRFKKLNLTYGIIYNKKLNKLVITINGLGFNTNPTWNIFGKTDLLFRNGIKEILNKYDIDFDSHPAIGLEKSIEYSFY